MPAVQDGKVFLVLRGDLEGRLEPSYYLPSIINVINEIQQSNFSLLKHICYPIKNGSTPNGGSFEEAGVLYYRSQDFDLYELSKSQYIKPEFHALISRSGIKVNDIMVAVVGATLGKIGFVKSIDFEGNINQNIARVRVASDSIMPEFLAIFLHSRLGQIQINRLATITTQAYLNNSQVGQISVPVPSLEIQQSIVAKFEAAYASKRAKEAEAAQLLASIDGYLLEQLGITFPREIEKKKTFFVSADKMSGRRFDPQYYKPKYLQLMGALESKPNEILGRLVKFSSETWNQKDYFATHFPYIEISEINLSKGTISNVSQIEISEAPSRAKMIVRKGDIIVSTTRPSRGAIAKITESEDFSIASTGFAVIRHFDSSRLEAEYLHTILRHQICLTQMEQRSSGGNYPAITLEELSNIKIPIPSIEIQKEIIAQINIIVGQAQQLEAEAKAEVEAAKKEVEAMILGDGGSESR